MSSLRQALPATLTITLTLSLLLACLCCPSLATSSLRPLNTTALPGSPHYRTPFESVRGVPYTVAYDDRAIVVNNVRTLLLAGSIHYPRFATAEWAHQFDMARLAGLNTVQTYVFWNWHEPARRQYDFESEGHQLTYFLELAAQYGLFVNLRVGPFICSEWSLGGIPYWMRDIEGVVFRSNETQWKQEMATFFGVIMKVVNPWLARNGGPIIMAQVENEYDLINHGTPGDAAYIQWCGDLALSFDSGLVWGMCKTDEAPRPLISTCNGIDCYLTIGPNRTQPAIWTEHWGAEAWNWKWGSSLGAYSNPAENMAYSTARWFAAGGGYLNYYMFSGGTTFGRWTGGPLLVNSYDYQSPVTEYGLARVDKYVHLALLHYILQQYSPVIIQGDMAINRQQMLPNGVLLLDYGNALFGLLFFVNPGSARTTVAWGGYKFLLEANSIQLRDWTSFDLLFDSSNVTLSLAVVSAAHVMDAYITPSSDMPYSVPASAVMQYIAEPHHIYQRNGVLRSSEPLELLTLAQYATDHVYYETNLTLTQQQVQAGSVLVNITNAVEHFHLFFNDAFIAFSASGAGSYSVDVSKLRAGSSYAMTLVVQADGSTNCCGGLEDTDEGLLGDVTVDGDSIRGAGWQQLVGLQGERNQLFAPNQTAPWQTLPSHPTANTTSSPFIWYKLLFQTPTLAINPPSPFPTYALDIAPHMGKGQAWVNGYHIGRYWNVSDTASGNYTQRYNHVPAAWLASEGGLNWVVLWEELGGDPSGIRLMQVLCCDPLN